MLDLRNSEQKALVDDDDWELVSAREWYLTTNGYVASWLIGERGVLLLHRLVTDAPSRLPKIHVDHKNGIKLDNRKDNLRVTSAALNQVNRHGLNHNNSSGFRGVTKCKNRWRAQITYQRKNIHIGLFLTRESAFEARKEAELKYYGESCPVS